MPAPLGFATNIASICSVPDSISVDNKLEYELYSINIYWHSTLNDVPFVEKLSCLKTQFDFQQIGAASCERRAYIGGSDARIIMGSDEAALMLLWRQKRGEVELEDLSGNLIVQLGLVTEALNRHWYERIRADRRMRPASATASGAPVAGGDP